MPPNEAPYDPAHDDALADVLDLIQQLLVTGNGRRPVDWTPEQLNELKAWLEARLASR